MEEQNRTETKMAEFEQGKVKFFGKGWGFLKRNNGQTDCFFHQNEFVDGLKFVTEGAELRFLVKKGDRGFYASQISMVEELI